MANRTSFGGEWTRDLRTGRWWSVIKGWMLFAFVAIVTAGCGSGEEAAVAIPQIGAISTTTAAPTTTTPPKTEAPTTAPPAREASTTTTIDNRTGTAAPSWLGTRQLDLQPGTDFGVVEPTPPELIDRQLWTVDLLPPPPGDAFVSSIEWPPPADVLIRSTFQDGCPVRVDQLAYAQVAFFGFDGRFHTGEFIARADDAEVLVNVFEQLHAMRFPIEQMEVTSQEDVDAHPTGDGNNTSSFVCRRIVGSTSWSRHALGGAIDLNPFHNPYVKGDVVLPELASSYLDRENIRPGMITDEVVAIFDEIGWGWGGEWRSIKDWMHFSDNGR